MLTEHSPYQDGLAGRRWLDRLFVAPGSAARTAARRLVGAGDRPKVAAP